VLKKTAEVQGKLVTELNNKVVCIEELEKKINGNANDLN
jgi:inorganic triphosphatase YgiF